MYIILTWGKPSHIMPLNTKDEASQDQHIRVITFGETFQPTMPKYNLSTSSIEHTQIQA